MYYLDDINEALFKTQNFTQFTGVILKTLAIFLLNDGYQKVVF